MTKNTAESVVKRFNKFHNDSYYYPLFDYKGVNKKITVICPKHGIFTPTIKSHFKSKCRGCAADIHRASVRLTKEEVLSKFRDKHGERYYYYDFKYVNYNTVITYVCPDHGNFESTVDGHLKGGCPKCGDIRTKESRRVTLKDFKKRSKVIHGEKYSYSEVNFTRVDQFVSIFCNNHKGFFLQQIVSHLSGNGCFACARKKHGKNITSTTEDFIKKATDIHDGYYDYSKVEYKGNRFKVEIICPKHSSFFQLGATHLKGAGCSKCRISHGERLLGKVLKEIKVNYKTQHIFEGCKYINDLLFDFYVPKYNIAIEYNGKQHYKEVKLWGGKEGLEKRIIRDKIKETFCKDNGINLLVIPYWEKKNISQLVCDYVERVKEEQNAKHSKRQHNS